MQVYSELKFRSGRLLSKQYSFQSLAQVMFPRVVSAGEVRRVFSSRLEEDSSTKPDWKIDKPARFQLVTRSSHGRRCNRACIMSVLSGRGRLAQW